MLLHTSANQLQLSNTVTDIWFPLHIHWEREKWNRTRDGRGEWNITTHTYTLTHKRKGFEERNRDTEILSSYITLILYGNLHHGDRHVTISNIPLMFYQFWGFYNLSLCYPFMADACAHFHLHIHGLMFVVIIPVARFFFFFSLLFSYAQFPSRYICNMQYATCIRACPFIFSTTSSPYRYMNINIYMLCR